MLCGALVATVSDRDGGTNTRKLQRWFQNFETTTSMERPTDGSTLSPCHSMHQPCKLSIPVTESAGRQMEVRDMAGKCLLPHQNNERAFQAEGTPGGLWVGVVGSRPATFRRLVHTGASGTRGSVVGAAKGENPRVGGASRSGTGSGAMGAPIDSDGR